MEAFYVEQHHCNEKEKMKNLLCKERPLSSTGLLKADDDDVGSK